MTETIMTLGDLDNTNVPSEIQRENSNFIKLLFIPPSAKPPIVGKILADFRRKNNPYFPIKYHEFLIGPNPTTDVRWFFAPSCYGEKDPLEEIFWKAMKERAELKKKVVKTKADENQINYLTSVINATKTKEGALCYFLQKGEGKFDYLFMKQPMMRALFGFKGDAKNGPIDGLIKKMKEEGISPFNFKDAAGWIRLYKQGSGSATTFHAEIDKTKVDAVINNRKVKVDQATEFEVDKELLSSDLSKIKDFQEICRMYTWTPEEVQEYIESDFSKFPQRYLKKTGGEQRQTAAGNDSSGITEAVDSEETGYGDGELASNEDLPF